ncbi:unnamed protein product, partial [Mesorhabditis spiculigera]
MPGILGPSSSSRDSDDFSIQLTDASCPACMQMYSDSEPKRVPRLPPLCGHSMCTECIGKVRACVVCRRGFYGDSTHFKINYTLMGLVSELAKQGEVPDSTAKCASCEGRSRVERMRVCRTCARQAKIDVKKAKIEEMTAHVFCSDCAIEKHLDKKHDMDKYLDYYNRLEMQGITEKMKSDLCGIRDTVLQIGVESQAGAQKWIHEMNKLCQAGTKIRSTEEGHRMREQANEEVQKLQDAVAALQEAQKLFNEISEESRLNLRKQMDDLRQVRRKERGRGIFGRFGGFFYRSLTTRKKAIAAPEVSQDSGSIVSADKT